MGAPSLSRLIRWPTARSSCCSPSTSTSSSSISFTKTACRLRCAHRCTRPLVDDLLACQGVLRASAHRAHALDQASEPGSAPNARALVPWHVCGVAVRLRIGPRVVSVKSTALRRGVFFNTQLGCEHVNIDKGHPHKHKLHHQPRRITRCLFSYFESNA